MSPAFDRQLSKTIKVPAPAPETENRLDVVVVFTAANATVAALKKAGTLAESLDAQITLVVPQVVPYPLPLTSPPVLLDFQERRFTEIARESPVDIRVQLYLCRDAMMTLKSVLRPHSLVIVGAEKRWWPTAEKRLARHLRKAGHEVVLTEAN